MMVLMAGDKNFTEYLNMYPIKYVTKLTPRLLGWLCREQRGRLRRRPVADPEPRHRGVEEDQAEPAHY